MKKNRSSSARSQKRHPIAHQSKESPRQQRWLNTCQWALDKPIELLIDILDRKIKVIEDYPFKVEGETYTKPSGVSRIDLNAIESALQDLVKDIKATDKNGIELNAGDLIQYDLTDNQNNPMSGIGTFESFESHRGSQVTGKVVISLSDGTDGFLTGTNFIYKI